MIRLLRMSGLVCLLAWVMGPITIGRAAEPTAPPRCGLWVDVYDGEPVTFDDLLDDLADVRVVYLGERHTVARHHELQRQIVAGLAARGQKLVVALEQMESSRQPKLDEFNAGKLTFAELATATDWARRWPDYQQYEPILAAARQAGAPVIALNAPAETIRQVARGGGVERLPADVRKQLPEKMQLDDPAYQKLLELEMMVHVAANPQTLRPMIEAQISRDEAMAAALCGFLQSPAGQGRTAIVICGAGHVAYGLGTPARVRRRLPEARDRIVVFSESGDVELSPAELAAARAVRITHAQLRQMTAPIADYLHVLSRRSAAAPKD